MVELERCEKGLARELEDMHVLHRDKHQVASTLFQLQPMEDETNVAENNASDLRRVYATVDGAKTLTRVLKAVQPSEGKDLRGTTVEVSVLRPENGLSQDKISREHVFALSFLLNNTAQNAESVGPVEMVKAATVVIGNLFQDQECVRQREIEGLEVLRRGRIPRDRRTKLTKQLNSLFLSKSSSAGQSLCASVSSSFLQSVFAMATEDPRHDVSTIFVDAALSGKYVLSLSDSETDLDMEKRERRLQFLAQFKASVDSNIAIPVNRETGENTNVTFSELVNAAVETLLQMTGGTPHADGVVQEDVPGTSLTRSEARDYVYMASVLASKPASQSLFLYAHRFHPEAARVAFNTQNVLAKRNRGLGKRKAGDFESFLSLAILLSLASGLQKSCPPDADKPFASGFRKSWSQMAFSIASLFCRALQKIEELPSFPGSTDTTSDEHVGSDLEGQRQELMEIFQDIVTKTQKLDEEFCRSLQSLGAPETGKLFCEQESAAPIRPSFIGNKIEAIDRLWSVIFAEVGTPSFQGQALGSILTSLTLPRQLPGNDGQQVPEVPVEELASVAAGEEKEEEEDNLSCPLEGPLGTVNDQCEPGSQPQPQAAAEKKTVAMDSVDDTIDATVDKGLPREEIRRSAYDLRERNTAVSTPKDFFALASARKKSRRKRNKQKVNTAA